MLYKHKKGFTAVEILITLAILGILGSIVIGGFNSLNRRQAIDKDALLVVAILNEARSLTISSKEDSKYGVHVDETESDSEIVLFKGNSYSSSDPDNITSGLSTYSEISAHSLSGSGDDIIFERLTGSTANTGTITLRLRSDNSVTRTITVGATGVIDSN